MTKKELRKIYIAKRLALTSQELALKSTAIVATFFEQVSLQNIHYLHIFLSIPEKKEINTQDLIQQIWNQFPHIQLVTSVTNFQTNTLSHHLLQPHTIIQPNKWGIPEPVDSPLILEKQIEMVIVPLLCMDKKGHRVGYGKGHYDKFLERCSSHTIKIGFSFFEPLVQIQDVEKWDIPLDYGIYCDESSNAHLLKF